MRRPGGYAQILSPQRSKVVFDRLRCQEVGEGLFEADTFTCCHCGGLQHVSATERTNEEFFCRNCMARICPPCADHPCIPLMKRIEREEARAYALRSYFSAQ